MPSDALLARPPDDPAGVAELARVGDGREHLQLVLLVVAEQPNHDDVAALLLDHRLGIRDEAQLLHERRARERERARHKNDAAHAEKAARAREVASVMKKDMKKDMQKTAMKLLNIIFFLEIFVGAVSFRPIKPVRACRYPTCAHVLKAGTGCMST